MKHVSILGLLALLMLSVVGYAQSTDFIKNVDGTWTLATMPDYNADLAVQYKNVSESQVNNLTFTKNTDGTWTMQGKMPDCDIELVVEYEDFVDYGFSVYVTEVTSENRDDILGNGVFSYDPGSKTLTVHKSYLSPYNGILVDNQNVEGLVVSVPEDVTLSAYQGFLSKKDMTITGPGHLTVSTQMTTTDMMDGSKLVIKDIAIDAECDKWGIAGENNEYLIIQNAAINSKAPRGAICDFNGGITLTGCKIIEPVGGYVKNGDVVDASGNLATEVFVARNGDANLDGAVDIADVVAVLNAMANDSNAPQFNVNDDNVVDIADVVAVLNIMAGQ